MKRLVLTIGLLAAVPALAHAAPLRIAAPGKATGACAALPASAPAGERAYYALLAKRLEVEVQKCPVADAAAAGAALAAGQADLAVLDPAAFAPVAKTVRAILTVRPDGSLNRIPIVVAVKSGSGRKTLADLRGGVAAFGGVGRAAYDTPRRALADQGADAGFFAREDRPATPDLAAAELRAGNADALVLNAAAWQRLCRGDEPGEDLCKDLTVVWRGRPRAAKALAVRRDMPEQLRYRLIGIHMPMHLEAKDAFAWGSSWIAGGAEFEPTEADALLAAQAAR